MFALPSVKKAGAAARPSAVKADAGYAKYWHENIEKGGMSRLAETMFSIAVRANSAGQMMLDLQSRWDAASDEAERMVIAGEMADLYSSISLDY
jgi:hypothetical protein